VVESLADTGQLRLTTRSDQQSPNRAE